ncbi:MAG: Ig-like domain-containing protein, partial [SAR324 cluster bacterium]|nr:Ig-like domain-containing protein [SAR324 cluster bacterium]
MRSGFSHRHQIAVRGKLWIALLAGGLSLGGCYNDLPVEAQLQASAETVSVGETVTFDASGSEYDKIAWKQDHVKLYACSGEETCSLIFTETGTYTIRVEVSKQIRHGVENTDRPQHWLTGETEITKDQKEVLVTVNAASADTTTADTSGTTTDSTTSSSSSTTTSSSSSSSSTATDTTAPTVSSTSPTDAATSVAVATTISVTFSEAMKTSTITTNTGTSCSGNIQLSSDSFSTCVAMSSTIANSSDKTFTLTPAASLSGITTYKIRVTTGVQDAAGNALASASTQATGFTTADVTAPTVASTSPTDAATSVAVGSTISVTFSEAMKTSTLTTNTADTTCSGTLQVSSDSFSTCVQMTASPTASNSDKTFTVTPSANLSGSTTYKIRVTTGVQDAAGNALASASTQGTGFTTVPLWAPQAYVKAANAQTNDQYGHKVAISGDTMIVGVLWEDSNQTTITNGTTASSNNSASDSGAVYVYKRTGTSWAQEAYLKAPNAETNDNFGNSVAISGDRVAVGASTEHSNQTTITNGTTATANNGQGESGAAYVYKRTGTTWEQEAYLKAPNAESNDAFGYSVAIDSDTVVVGAPQEDSNQTTITNGTTVSDNDSQSEAGAAYVFKRSGTTWAHEAYFKASNAASGDNFGINVAVSGTTIVVGAHIEDSNATTITNGTTASSDNSASGSGA